MGRYMQRRARRKKMVWVCAVCWIEIGTVYPAVEARFGGMRDGCVLISESQTHTFAHTHMNV